MHSPIEQLHSKNFALSFVSLFFSQNWGRRHIFLEFLYGANMINESPIATSNSVIRKRAIGHVLEINDLTRFICEYL